VPISSEFYNKEVLRRSVFLSEKFDSSITLNYILEKKTLDHAMKSTETYLSDLEITETKEQMIKEKIKTADKIIFEDAKNYFKDRKVKITDLISKGEFSDCVTEELDKNSYDLVLMGFDKECLLKYRLFEDVEIPVWVEEKSEGNTILAVCSNLAPNRKVPEISQKLSKVLGWKLHMIYVLDTEDSVQVDENGTRSDKKEQRDLLFNAQNFLEEMKKKNIEVEMKKGSLERQTAKAAHEINASLVIVGREQKRRGMLGMPVKNVRKKIAEKCKYSILFLH
jgi:hypothetical protein